MSFSFNLVGRDKDEVKSLVDAKMTEIAGQQMAHEHDKAAVASVVLTYLDLIDDKALDHSAVHVSVSGSVGWLGSQDAPVYNGAGINVSVRAVPV